CAHMRTDMPGSRASVARTRRSGPDGSGPLLLDVDSGDALAGAQHLVDDAVLLRLLGGEDIVAVDVGVDLLDRLAGVTSHGLLEPGAHPQDLPRLDLDVGGLPLTGLAHRRLVHEHTRVRQCETLAGRAGGEQ